jgi:sulfite dehydrogenase (cytochrome) subunit A
MEGRQIREMHTFARRRFLSTLLSFGGVFVASQAFGRNFNVGSTFDSLSDFAAGSRTLARYPQKTDLILLTDRPPQLETPLSYFQTDLTPNDAFFVRWHLSGIPTSVDTMNFRLEISGHVQKPLSLSLRELQTKFEPVSLVALCQCSGNSRSLFEPRVPGGQWGNGAMGNARWTGVRLKDVLDAAGILPGAVQVGLHGLDVSPQANTPRFAKSLQIEHARDGEVMIAYKMNDQPLPMLNGFPIRLIVPGWYATYWVKALSSITVLDRPLQTYWMDKAYRIPNNPQASEDPSHLSEQTVPISVMPVHSIFLQPELGKQLRAGRKFELTGVATDGLSGVKSVEVSLDAGQSWTNAELGRDLGKYSWRRWRLEWIPAKPGDYRLMVRATTSSGERQVTRQWNRSGYWRDVIEHQDVKVV